jgi:hypothetical protein
MAYYNYLTNQDHHIGKKTYTSFSEGMIKTKMVDSVIQNSAIS